MAKNPSVRRMTLASVAVGLECPDCRTGPDEVHLTATICGIGDGGESSGSDPVWSMLLYQRQPVGMGNYQHRQPPATLDGGYGGKGDQ
jgi:hypothetical protein